jgi:plastocyanin
MENVVVYLEPLGVAVPAPDISQKARLDQKEKTFIPHVLPIPVGASVEITNQDGIYHNVFSLSDIRPFNIGRRPTGERVPVRFDKPGVVRVFCDIHSHMSAFIVVLDTPYFAKPREAGVCELDGVRPGRYRAMAWHPSLSAEAQEITVPESGPVHLEFVLRQG